MSSWTNHKIEVTISNRVVAQYRITFTQFMKYPLTFYFDAKFPYFSQTLRENPSIRGDFEDQNE